MAGRALEITCYVASGPPPTSSPTPGLARVLEEAELSGLHRQTWQVPRYYP